MTGHRVLFTVLVVCTVTPAFGGLLSDFISGANSLYGMASVYGNAAAEHAKSRYTSVKIPSKTSTTTTTTYTSEGVPVKTTVHKIEIDGSDIENLIAGLGPLLSSITSGKDLKSGDLLNDLFTNHGPQTTSSGNKPQYPSGGKPQYSSSGKTKYSSGDKPQYSSSGKTKYSSGDTPQYPSSYGTRPSNPSRTSSGSSPRPPTNANAGPKSPSRKSAQPFNSPSTDTSYDGGNGDIFFPYEPKLSETDKVNQLYRSRSMPSSIMTYSSLKCTSNIFFTLNGKAHLLTSVNQITEAEKNAAFNEGACSKVKMQVFFEKTPNGHVCYAQNDVMRREYNMLKDTYKDIHVVTKKRCNFQSMQESQMVVSADPLKWMSYAEKEPEHFQNIGLVVYDCKTPNIPLSSSDKKIWELDNKTLKLKNDGTQEHVRNLRKAGCTALGYFAMTMYQNVPMANSTATMYNCPARVDGYEKQVGGNYKRKWRKDWKADNCYPTITKTQLDKDGNLQSITARNFQSDDMTIEFATAKGIPDVGKAILRKAETFLDLFPKVKLSGGIVKAASYVRRYFDNY